MVAAQDFYFHRLEAYQYNLPQELVAQRPLSHRDRARLMIVNRRTGDIGETVFCELPSLLQTGMRLVFNNTKVIPARLIGRKESGAQVEVLLTKEQRQGVWEAVVRPARKLLVGDLIHFGEHFSSEVIGAGARGLRIVRFSQVDHFWKQLALYGKVPLPPYIRRVREDARDVQDYQTVYASQPGAIAAPTAGLHFTKDLLQELSQKKIDQTEITLHVGMGTFLPVHAEDIRTHEMHDEQCHISPQAASELNTATASKGSVLVGTTCCRALESAATDEGVIVPGEYRTNLFIYPGYVFKYTQGLLTNFHLPGSTLLMLVSAFAGYELTMEAYRKAVEKRFRFFSYGDAMLII